MSPVSSVLARPSSPEPFFINHLDERHSTVPAAISTLATGLPYTRKEVGDAFFRPEAAKIFHGVPRPPRPYRFIFQSGGLGDERHNIIHAEVGIVTSPRIFMRWRWCGRHGHSAKICGDRSVSCGHQVVHGLPDVGQCAGNLWRCGVFSHLSYKSVYTQYVL